MTRERDLLLKAAEALEAGTDPFSPHWLAENSVDASECFDLSENIAKCIRICTGGVDWQKAAKEAFRRVVGTAKQSGATP